MTIVRYIDGQCYMFSLTEDELLAAYKWVQREEDEATVLDILQFNGCHDEFEALMDSPKLLYQTAKNYRERANKAAQNLDMVEESLPFDVLEAMPA